MKDIVKNENGNGGIGFFGLLGVVFIALKLMGHIDWSWIWVTLPLWGGFVFAFGVLFIMFLFHDRHRRW